MRKQDCWIAGYICNQVKGQKNYFALTQYEFLFPVYQQLWCWKVRTRTSVRWGRGADRVSLCLYPLFPHFAMLCGEENLYIFKGVTCKAVKPKINLKVRRYLYKKRTIVSLFACLQGSNFRALDRVVMQLINNKDKGKPTIRNSNSKDSLAIGNLVNYMNISALCFYFLLFG